MFHWLAGLFGYVKLPDHWSFPVASTTELSYRLDHAGAGSRLEVRLDRHRKMTLRVVPAAAARTAATAAFVSAEPDINESHLCPGPLCPD